MPVKKGNSQQQSQNQKTGSTGVPYVATKMKRKIVKSTNFMALANEIIRKRSSNRSIYQKASITEWIDKKLARLTWDLSRAPSTTDHCLCSSQGLSNDDLAQIVRKA